jgi:cbb3-type cytochrome oxidase subunit 1
MTFPSLDGHREYRRNNFHDHPRSDRRLEPPHDHARAIRPARYSPTLRFTIFGAIAYTVFSLVGVLISLRSMAGYVQFTQAHVGYSHLGLYAFFTMVMFGSMYYIVPRLVGREWRYASLIKLHFWASAYGVMLMVLMLLVSGLCRAGT